MKIRLVPFSHGFFCSECGTFYSFYEADKYYLRFPCRINCYMCGAVFGKEIELDDIQLSLFD